MSSLLIKVLILLQTTMDTPTSWGWFHLMWVGLTIISIVILHKYRNLHGEKQLKTVIGTYSIVALILEIIKQLIWTFSYDTEIGIIVDYQWYAAPFQLCTTPIYVCFFCLFLKNTKLRKALLSYIAFFTILGGFFTILLPESCFTSMIVVNIHTMWLHCGSFVVSVYLLMSKELEITICDFKNAFKVFLFFVGIATLLNISIYNSGILNGETFNMFYISPYFISSLPVFDTIQQNVPYIIYLFIYIFALTLGATLVYNITKVITYFEK